MVITYRLIVNEEKDVKMLVGADLSIGKTVLKVLLRFRSTNKYEYIAKQITQHPTNRRFCAGFLCYLLCLKECLTCGY